MNERIPLNIEVVLGENSLIFPFGNFIWSVDLLGNQILVLKLMAKLYLKLPLGVEVGFIMENQTIIF